MKGEMKIMNNNLTEAINLAEKLLEDNKQMVYKEVKDAESNILLKIGYYMLQLGEKYDFIKTEKWPTRCGIFQFGKKACLYQEHYDAMLKFSDTPRLGQYKTPELGIYIKSNGDIRIEYKNDPDKELLTKLLSNWSGMKEIMETQLKLATERKLLSIKREAQQIDNLHSLVTNFKI